MAVPKLAQHGLDAVHDKKNLPVIYSGSRRGASGEEHTETKIYNTQVQHFAREDKLLKDQTDAIHEVKKATETVGSNIIQLTDYLKKQNRPHVKYQNSHPEVRILQNTIKQNAEQQKKKEEESGGLLKGILSTLLKGGTGAAAIGSVAALGVAALGPGILPNMVPEYDRDTASSVRHGWQTAKDTVSDFFGAKSDHTIQDYGADKKKVAAGIKSLKGNTELGAVSQFFESNGRGVAAYNKDNKGWAYGKHQINSAVGTMSAFLRSKYAEKYRPYFDNLAPGSAAFNEKYAQVAAQDPKGFDEAQHNFILATHYQPTADFLKKKFGLDVDTRSRALREMVFSNGVDAPGQARTNYINAFGNRDVTKLTDREIISLVQNYKRDNANWNYSSSSKAVQQGRAQRATDEKAILLNMLDSEEGTKAVAQQAGAPEPKKEETETKVKGSEIAVTPVSTDTQVQQTPTTSEPPPLVIKKGKPVLDEGRPYSIAQPVADTKPVTRNPIQGYRTHQDQPAASNYKYVTTNKNNVVRSMYATPDTNPYGYQFVDPYARFRKNDDVTVARNVPRTAPQQPRNPYNAIPDALNDIRSRLPKEVLNPTQTMQSAVGNIRGGLSQTRAQITQPIQQWQSFLGKMGVHVKMPNIPNIPNMPHIPQLPVFDKVPNIPGIPKVPSVNLPFIGKTPKISLNPFDWFSSTQQPAAPQTQPTTSPANPAYYSQEQPVIAQQATQTTPTIAQSAPISTSPEQVQRQSYDGVQRVMMVNQQEPQQQVAQNAPQGSPAMQSKNDAVQLEDIPAIMDDFGLVFINSGFI